MLLVCKKAIDKGDIVVNNDFYYWRRDKHEHVTGGEQVFKFEADPEKASNQNMEAMMELLEYAPWAEWSN